MSGTMPFCMYEKSAPVRPIPLWISSRISSAPCAVHSRRAACRNAGVPGVMPPSPCIGSRITAQTSSPPSARNAASSAATSLYGMCVMPAGLGPKPCEYFAWPPAVTVNSVRPWNALSVEMTRTLCGAVAVVRVAARELQRRLVRLGARIAEEHAVGERRVDQPLRQPQRRLVGEPVRHVPQRARLLVERADHRRVAMPERGHGDAAREVDVHAALLVPHARALAAHRHERRGRVAGHHQRRSNISRVTGIDARGDFGATSRRDAASTARAVAGSTGEFMGLR